MSYFLINKHTGAVEKTFPETRTVTNKDKTTSIVALPAPTAIGNVIFVQAATEAEVPAAFAVATKAAKNADLTRQRAARYVKESDPLFFKYQRGEIPESQWLAACHQIQPVFLC